MEKKIKVLLMLLGLVSLVSAGIAAWIYLSTQSEIKVFAKKHAELETQNKSLQQKLDASQEEARKAQRWRERSEAVTAALNRLGKEHSLLQSQYDSLLSERDSLAEKNKSLIEQLESANRLYAQVKEQPKVEPTDKFLAKLLQEKAALEVEIERLKQNISSQEAHLESMAREATPSQEKIERLEKEIEALEKKWQDAQNVSDVLSNNLLEERKKRDSLEEDLARSTKQLRIITQERDALSDQMVTMQQALERRLAELSQTKKVLESAVEGSKQVVKKPEPTPSIQLSPIVVKAQEEKTPVTPKLDKEKIIVKETDVQAGRIITANQRYKFVVIDLGRDDGIKKGMNFQVYRNGKKVGKIEVIEVRKDIAACDIKEINVKYFKVNDSVSR